jgi:hypothetical protein
LLTACREVAAFYKRWVAKSSETTTQETPLASTESSVRENRQSAQMASRSWPSMSIESAVFVLNFIRVDIARNNSSRVPVQSRPSS